MKLRLRWWRKPKKVPEPPRREPKQLDCRFCGPVVADPEEHLASPEHRLAQANALTPTPEEPE